MKFVCDSCNAKYQIGDDKVAGKTLRMKCRRCGHMIQVAATVTESSVSGRAPQPSAAPMPGPAEMSSEDGATVVKPSPLFLLEQSGLGGAQRSSGSSPPGPAIPRPGPSVAGTSPPFRGGPRIVPPARPSLRSIPPGATNPNTPLPPGTHSSSAPGLYGGFAQAVAVAPKPEAAAVPTEDWYVGVNGVPLGPVRLSVLRDKAAQGQVDGSSLVWREGFDEWAPAKNFPGLLAIIEEAKQIRASRTNMPAVSMPTPPVAPPRASAPAPQPAPSVGMQLSAPQPEPSIPFNLVSRTSHAPAQNDRPSISDHETSRASGAFGIAPVAPTTGPTTNGHTNGTANGGVVVGTAFDPFAPSAAPANGSAAWGGQAGLSNDRQPSQVFGLTTTSASSTELDKPPKKGIHPAVWAFVAMAAAFGGVAAWALFLRKPDVVYLPGQTNTVAVTTPTGANVPAPPTGEANGEPGEPVATVTLDASGKPVVTYGSGLRPTTTVAKSGEAVAPIDPSTLGPGPTGPSTTSTTDNPTAGPLTSGQISGVVSSNTARVRKKCWDPLSTGRSPDAPSSVKVNVEISISPSGSVSSAKASGGNEKYYPGLTSCVQGVVSAWKFPSATEPTTVRVPISFSAQ